MPFNFPFPGWIILRGFHCASNYGDFDRYFHFWHDFLSGNAQYDVNPSLTPLFLAIFHQGTRDDWRIVFRLYRGPCLLVIFIFFMGINVYGWRTSGVNHVLIFELDPRNHLSEQHLIEMSAIFGVVWTLSVLSFLYSKSLSIPPYANPLALIVLLILFMINPSKTFRHEARFWVLRTLVMLNSTTSLTSCAYNLTSIPGSNRNSSIRTCRLCRFLAGWPTEQFSSCTLGLSVHCLLLHQHGGRFKRKCKCWCKHVRQ